MYKHKSSKDFPTQLILTACLHEPTAGWQEAAQGYAEQFPLEGEKDLSLF